MLNYKKEYRLLLKKDFLFLREGSLFLRSKSLIIYCKHNNLGHSRLGISASKKFGNAIKRNHFKRLVRESFRHSDVLQKSHDILVVASTRYLPLKSKIRNVEKIQISKDLTKLFSSISS